MITIQKVTSNVQSVPHQSPDMFSKTMFIIAQSTFRMYSVIAIFKSSVVWGLFEYTESGVQRFFDHSVLLIAL